MGADRLGPSQSYSAAGKRPGRLDRLVRRAPARWIARRGVRTGLRQGSAGEWDRGPAAAKAWIRAHLPGSEGDDLKEGDSLKQQAALYTFRLADGRVVVAPEDARPEDQEATRDFIDESRRKAQGVARTSRAGPGRHPAATHGRATRRPPDSTDRIHPRRSRTVFAALP